MCSIRWQVDFGVGIWIFLFWCQILIILCYATSGAVTIIFP